ncbi:MAG TPA: hypothetical protein VHN20_02440 [Beijerinckiaceae bacterium]|nr:hypothetical protein [Beijerinckiaceae bacterium]
MTFRVLDEIQGTGLGAMREAIWLLRKHRLDVAQSRVEVIEDGGSHVVIFTMKDGARFGARAGSRTELPAKELERLSKAAPRRLHHVQGSSLAAADIAVRELEQRNLRLDGYKVDVVRDGDAIAVLFVDKDQERGVLGSAGRNPGFEVYLRASDLSLVRSNFVR